MKAVILPFALLSVFACVAEDARPKAAQWIAHPNGSGGLTWAEACDFTRPMTPAPCFRKRFELKDAVRGAKLYITGLGYFEAKLDGKPVSDYRLVPAPTAYDRRWRYFCFDLPELAAGAHVLSVLVGDGLYRSAQDKVWYFETAPWTDHPKMFCELEDAAGRLLLKSDDTWKVRFSPIVRTALRGGETYDARLEFLEDECDGKAWCPALIKPAPGGVGELERQPPCRAVAVYPAEGPDANGVWSLPKLIAGVPRLTVRGEAGSKVELICGERQADANATNELAYGFGQTDVYILKGGDVEQWEPRFTYHGFDRVKAVVTGKADVLKIEAVEVRTDFRRIGSIETSDERLMKIERAARVACLGNFVGIPTDCPHREKNGWLSEGRLMSEYLLYTFDAASAYAAYVDDIADAQRGTGQLPGMVPTGGWGYNWGSGPMYDAALSMIPDSIARFTGDRSLQDRTLKNLRKLCDYYRSMTSSDGLIRFGLGDWLPPSGASVAPQFFVTTAFAVKTCDQTSALCTRKGDAAAGFAAQAEALRQAILRAYYRGNGVFLSASSTVYGLALAFDIVPEADREACAAELDCIVRKNDCRVDYGTGGSGCVIRELFEAGYTDTAFEMIVQPNMPGYCYLVETLGLTSLTEQWNPFVDAWSSSRFHGAFSDVGACMFRYLAGLRHDADLDGAKAIRIKPCFPKALADFAAEHAGYRVAWKRQSGVIDLSVTVPEGKVAEVSLPKTKARRVGAGVYHLVITQE